ncbi:integumentary mucin C.1 [Toxotes jaculatrix]|uniref:integumentary mucin C.1 n=1 Tax=Toxotes jaculatrix TaxID=941984 RepID=UPI001B3A9C95|nr:integumentary mucin C.1 [Toxotes jaculatrix]
MIEERGARPHVTRGSQLLRGQKYTEDESTLPEIKVKKKRDAHPFSSRKCCSQPGDLSVFAVLKTRITAHRWCRKWTLLSPPPGLRPIPPEHRPLVTVPVECAHACGDGGVSGNKTSDPNNKSQTFSATEDQSSSSSSSPSTHTSVTHTDRGVPPTQSGSLSSQQPVSPDHQLPLPETDTQSAALRPSTITGSPTQAAQTGSITDTGTTTSTTAQPDRAVHTATVLVPSTTTTTTTTTITTTTTTTTTTPTTTTTATTTTTTPTTTTTTPVSTTTTAATTTTTPAPHPPTTVKATTTLTSGTTTVTVTTTTGTETAPPSSPAATPQPNATTTQMPAIQTTSVTSAITPANRNESVASGTGVAVVEVAGGALTRQLVDTASLLAVLLFGLLFFLVTVAVFATQAYESYRRKDYTQVDYLINGMYSDSGV